VQERLVEGRLDALKRCVDIANEEACDLFYPFHVKPILSNNLPFCTHINL